MTPIPLTAKQIAFADELHFDQIAIDNTLKAALQYHSNRTNELEKNRKIFWEELAAIHGLDIDNIAYGLKVVNGAVCIDEPSPEEKPEATK